MTDEQVHQAVTSFNQIPDFRANRGLNHRLSHLMVMTLYAVMSGADSFPEIQAFVESKRGWLGQYVSD
ncbi:transposase family protein [Deinococcus saxicola]|uniref:transposase family protein n=1 Tax=Deinococcus saxicola TaxID=249406 RepID=UPI0039EED99D